jgi:hypothetical protein
MRIRDDFVGSKVVFLWCILLYVPPKLGFGGASSGMRHKKATLDLRSMKATTYYVAHIPQNTDLKSLEWASS